MPERTNQAVDRTIWIYALLCLMAWAVPASLGFADLGSTGLRDPGAAERALFWVAAVASGINLLMAIRHHLGRRRWAIRVATGVLTIQALLALLLPIAAVRVLALVGAAAWITILVAPRRERDGYEFVVQLPRSFGLSLRLFAMGSVAAHAPMLLSDWGGHAAAGLISAALHLLAFVTPMVGLERYLRRCEARRLAALTNAAVASALEDTRAILPVAPPPVFEASPADIAEMERLRDDVSSLRSMLDAIPHQVFLKDRSGRYAAANRAFAEYHGHTTESVVGLSATELLDDEERAQRFAEYEDEVLKKGRARQMTENTPPDPKGIVRWFHTLMTPVVSGSGSERKLVGVSTDVTERIRAVEDFEESRQVLQGVLESTDDGFLVVDNAGHIVFTNHRFAEMWNIPDELIGRGEDARLVEFVVSQLKDPKAFRKKIKELYNSEAISQDLLHFRDGRVFDRISRALVRAGEIRGRVWCFREVSEAFLREKELRVSKERAESASKAKSDFLANMSHEIRTPMTGVVSMIDLLRQTSLDQDQVEFLEVMASSASGLMTIINDILDFSRIEAGRLAVHLAPFDPWKVIEGVVSLLRASAEAKGIELRLSFPSGAPKMIVGDQGRIRQVLTNLLGNAVKFTQSGTVEVIVRVIEEELDPHVRIAVRDTGIGISEDHLEDIFEQFTQADASNTRQFGGTGLGLAISRELVGLMGGEIGVESSEGEGSTFWFTIPLITTVDGDREMLGAGHPLRVLQVVHGADSEPVWQRTMDAAGIHTTTVQSMPDVAAALQANARNQQPFDAVMVHGRSIEVETQELLGKLSDDESFGDLPFLFCDESGANLFSTPGDAVGGGLTGAFTVVPSELTEVLAAFRHQRMVVPRDQRTGVLST